MKELLTNIDIIKTFHFILIGIGIGLGVYLGRYTKSFIIWIKGGVENGDGVLQNKELQIMWFSFLFAFMVMGTTFFDKAYPLEMILGALAGAGVMYGINALAKKTKEKEDEEKKQ